MSLRTQMTNLARDAKRASLQVAALAKNEKNKILKDMAKALQKNTVRILRANAKDVKNGRRKGLSSALLDRLRLDEKRIALMADSILEVARLHDPVGKILREWKRPNGLKLRKVSVPLGVILVIYEARPNVTAECVSLSLKSGNSIILKGGSEAYCSNHILATLFRDVLKKNNVPQAAVSFVSTTDRKAVDALVVLTEYISVVIPRGGEGLIRAVVEKSKIPVIKHYKGICHVYVDEAADLTIAENIVLNAKLQRPGVCNAMETLLVHAEIAPFFLPTCVRRLQSRGCEIRGCSKTRTLLRGVPGIRRASREDYETEYLDLILSVRIVDSLDEAIEHIRTFGSAHTDAIVTENKRVAQKFIDTVDSSSVMVNASTRFSDGNQYGLGAEIGISTDKIHARGPMGLEGLTSYKYIVLGKGQIRT
ncbi:MAG: glutamate-5-semialdehyde dehydrogenase [Candidatus Omnitrophica bacterium]|nr:glutamate-5-semialdehyde dehydrogenase [Candidatus Omnitrophota bacterium]